MPDPETPEPGETAPDEPLVPLDELEAAWREVEAVAGGGEEAGTAASESSASTGSVEDGQPAAQADGAGAETADVRADSSVPGTAGVSSEEGRPKKRGGGMRFVVGKRRKPEDEPSGDSAGGPAEATKAQDAVGAAAASGQGPVARAAARAQPSAVRAPVERQSFLPRVPWWKRLLRAIDDLLDVINRPFASLSPQHRSLIGVVSVTTIVVSWLSAWLIPVLMPHRDAITFLEQARAAVLSREGAAGADSSEPAAAADDSDSGASARS